MQRLDLYWSFLEMMQIEVFGGGGQLHNGFQFLFFCI